MVFHRNAKLGLAGRYALVRDIEGGCSLREAARRHGVSPATACSWSRCWRVRFPRGARCRSILCSPSVRIDPGGSVDAEAVEQPRPTGRLQIRLTAAT